MKRTDKLRGADKVRQKLLSVRVIDGQPEKVAVLDEIGFWAVGADVDFVCDVVILRDVNIVISGQIRGEVRQVV